MLLIEETYIVVSQLNQTFTIRPVFAVRKRLFVIVGHKVQIELGLGLFNLLDQLHAQKLIVLD
jgi:hypothetical protein